MQTPAPSSVAAAKRPATDNATPQKAARLDNELLLFDITSPDESPAAFQSVALAGDALKKVPYLDVLMNTPVGTAQLGRRQIKLPPGCTVEACCALIQWAVVEVTDHLRAEIEAETVDMAVALMQTADFLMLTDLLPKLSVICQRVARTPEDISRLRQHVPTSPAVESIVKSFDGNALFKAMSTEQVSTMVRALGSSGMISATQAKVLVRWLQIEGRSPDQAASALFGLCRDVIWIQISQEPLKLKSGAASLLSQLSTIASCRPPLFNTILEVLFKSARASSSYKYSEDSYQGLGCFVHSCIEPCLTGSRSMIERKKILQLLLQKHLLVSASTAIVELLSPLLDGHQLCFQEVKMVLPMILPFNIMSDASYKGAVGQALLERARRLLDDAHRFTDQELQELLPIATSALRGAGLHDEIPKFVVKLLTGAAPSVQSSGSRSSGSQCGRVPGCSISRNRSFHSCAERCKRSSLPSSCPASKIRA